MLEVQVWKDSSKGLYFLVIGRDTSNLVDKITVLGVTHYRSVHRYESFAKPTASSFGIEDGDRFPQNIASSSKRW
jgi:hypothetical protein